METRRCERQYIIINVATAPSVMYVSTCELETYSPGEGISSLPAACILYTYLVFRICSELLFKYYLCEVPILWHRAFDGFIKNCTFYFLFLF